MLAGGFIGLRCATRVLLRLRHGQGHVWRVIILGSGRIAREVASKIEQHPEMLCKVVGLLFPTQAAEGIAGTLLSAASSQVSTLDIFGLLRASCINEIVVALPHPLSPEIRTLINRARDMGIETSVVPQSYELYAFRPKLLSLDGLPLLKLREPGLRRRYVVLKRLLDMLVAAFLLTPAVLLLEPISEFIFLKKRAALPWDPAAVRISFRMLRLNVQRPVVNGSIFEKLLNDSALPNCLSCGILRGQMSLVLGRESQLFQPILQRSAQLASARHDRTAQSRASRIQLRGRKTRFDLR